MKKDSYCYYCGIECSPDDVICINHKYHRYVPICDLCRKVLKIRKWQYEPEIVATCDMDRGIEK